MPRQKTERIEEELKEYNRERARKYREEKNRILGKIKQPTNMGKTEEELKAHRREKTRKWREENKEKTVEIQNKSAAKRKQALIENPELHEKVKERAREAVAKIRAENPEKVKQQRQEYLERRGKLLQSNPKLHDEQRQKVAKNMREWRAKNPEKSREASRRSNTIWWSKKENREKQAAQKREEYAANPEKFRERNKRNTESRKEKDPELFYNKRRLKAKKWCNENREKLREYQRNWYRKNPDKYQDIRKKAAERTPMSITTWGANARARRYNNNDYLSVADVETLAKTCNYTCTYCSKTPVYGIDHLTPLCRKGSNKIDNICICCQRCNSQKGKFTHIQYLEYLEEIK